MSGPLTQSRVAGEDLPYSPRHDGMVSGFVEIGTGGFFMTL